MYRFSAADLSIYAVCELIMKDFIALNRQSAKTPKYFT
jgi:hypothetical protein